MTTFTTTLLQIGNNVGIEVPEDVVLSFGVGKRVPVHVEIEGYRYDSTIAVMGGKYLISLSAANRTAAGVAGGEEHEVTLELIEGERTVEVPDDLATALADAGLREAFDALSYSKRKEHARSVADAKAPETRARRVTKVLDAVRG